MPIILPVYALLAMMYIETFPGSMILSESMYHMSDGIKDYILIFFGLYLFVCPALSLVVFRLLGLIDTIELDERKQRNIPIFLTLFFASLLAYSLHFQLEKQIVPNVIYAIAYGSVVIAATSLIINQFTKISLHAIGAGALLGIMFGFYLGLDIFPLWVLLVVALLGGLIIAARIYLEKHTLSQIGMGYALGFLVNLGSILIVNSL